MRRGRFERRTYAARSRNDARAGAAHTDALTVSVNGRRDVRLSRQLHAAVHGLRHAGAFARSRNSLADGDAVDGVR